MPASRNRKELRASREDMPIPSHWGPDQLSRCLMDPSDPKTLVMSGFDQFYMRPIRCMETQHLRWQLKWGAREPESLRGWGRYIRPNLESELERRTLEDFDEDNLEDHDEDETFTTGANTMNLKNMAALIREDITTIRVSHDNEAKTYVYLCPQDVADQLRDLGYVAGKVPKDRDAQVLVKNRNGVTLGDVVEVHSEPQIDLDYNGQYRYAFAVVDTSRVDQLEKEDAEIHERLKQQKKRSVRDQVLASLGIQDPSEFLADLRTSKELGE